MVGQLPPLFIRPCTCPLAVHCPFRESQFLWQHPTLVFICRYFFWFFSCLPDCVMKTLSLSQFFVCVCVLVLFRYVPYAVFFHYSYDPCASYLSVCVFGLALATFAYCLHLQHITKVAAACTFTLHIIYIHIIYTSVSVANLLGLFPFCLTNSLQALWQKMIDYNIVEFQ